MLVSHTFHMPLSSAAQSQGLNSFLYCPACEWLGQDEDLQGDRTRTADPNQPKGHKVSCEKKYKTEGSMLGAVLLLGDWLGISQCFLHHLFSKYVHIYMNSTGPRADSWGTSLVTSLHSDIETLITTLWPHPANQFLIHRTVHPSNPKVYIKWQPTSNLETWRPGWSLWL